MNFDELIVIWWKFYAVCAGLFGFSVGVLVTIVVLAWTDGIRNRQNNDEKLKF